MNDNPCFHCPNRHVGCAAHCNKWAVYLAEREKEYKHRLLEYRATYVLKNHFSHKTYFPRVHKED